MVIFDKRKKYNEIQFTKNKMDMFASHIIA